MTAARKFEVTVKLVREYCATITVCAGAQAEADEKALLAFNGVAATRGLAGCDLLLPPPWEEWSRDLEPEIDKTFRCVDCEKDTSDEYYMVHNEVWAATGLGPNDGMLCLACLERRIGRPLSLDDFTALVPSKEGWQRHVASRKAPASPIRLQHRRIKGYRLPPGTIC